LTHTVLTCTYIHTHAYIHESGLVYAKYNINKLQYRVTIVTLKPVHKTI